MKCEICEQTATEKHHINYFPEQTVGVCAFHGDDIHRNSGKYPGLLMYAKNDAKEFYDQNKRISKFLKYLSDIRKSCR